MNNFPAYFLIALLCCCLIYCTPSVAFASSENWVEVARFTDEIWLMPDYTGPFIIDCKEWRVRWEVVSIFYLGDLSFWVVPQGNHGGTSFNDSLGIAGINQPVTTDGALNVTNNPGTYYLFTGTSGSKYTLIVEQNMDSLQEPEGNWVEVVSYSGGSSSFVATPSFRIDFDEWRIKWEYNPLFSVDDPNVFDFWVVPEENRIEGEFDPATSIAGVYNPITKNGTIYISQMTEKYFYLHIAPGSSEWRIIVEQNMDSIPEFPSWMVLPFFLITSLLVIISRKHLRKQF